jgi:hypothetical protein
MNTRRQNEKRAALTARFFISNSRGGFDRDKSFPVQGVHLALLHINLQIHDNLLAALKTRNRPRR